MKDQNNTRKPGDNIQEMLVVPQDLVGHIAALAIENYALGTFELDENDVFRAAIEPIAKVWVLDALCVESTLGEIQNACEMLNRDDDEPTDFKDFSGSLMLRILATLTDTIVYLDELSDRQAIANLVYFLKDYWAIEDNIK